MLGLLERVVPAIGWLRTYRRSDLAGDLSAGVTVAVMLVPQGMAYAMLAGLPLQVGLYASTIPLIVYAVFGASRQLAVGPTALVSLLVATGCAGLAAAGSPEYVAYAGLLALLVGLIQVVLGVARLGALVNFVSHAVILGFTWAAELIIALSQFEHLMGVKIERTEGFSDLVANLAVATPATHIPTLVMGVSCIALLVVLGRYAKRVPAALLVCAAASAAVAVFHLDRIGVRTVGEVPAGLPTLSLPALDPAAGGKLIPTALAIALVGFLESFAVAKFIAARERQPVAPNQDLVGLGLANVGAALASGYPVTGGFSRTAVNYKAGARTGLAGIITASIVLLTLAFLTPLFSYIPKAVLAAIVVVAVAGLVDFREVVRIFRIKPRDGWVLVITFATGLAVGIEAGILVGIALSLMLFIWHSSHPHMAELGWVEEGVYRNVARFPEARVFEGCVVLRPDASLYFANMGFVDSRVRSAVLSRPGVKNVVLDLSAVNDIDAVAVHMLEQLIEDCAAQGVRVLLSGMKGPVRDVVARAGWERKLGPGIAHKTISAALREIGVLGE